MKSKKTICVLSETNFMMLDGPEHRFCRKNTTVCLLEAYSSWDDAFESMDEEFQSFLNELLFKNCTCYSIAFDYDYDSDLLNKATITYKFDEDDALSKVIFEIECVDLVLKK